eukprot:1954930-Rhodomonas_salina.1
MRMLRPCWLCKSARSAERCMQSCADWSRDPGRRCTRPSLGSGTSSGCCRLWSSPRTPRTPATSHRRSPIPTSTAAHTP